MQGVALIWRANTKVLTEQSSLTFTRIAFMFVSDSFHSAECKIGLCVLEFQNHWPYELVANYAQLILSFGQC